MSSWGLFDVAPSPPPVAGYAGLALLVIIVLGLAAALIVGFGLLLKRIKRRRANPLGGRAPSSGNYSPE